MIPFALATALISQKFAIKKKKDSDDSQSIDRKKSSAAKDFKLLQDSKDGEKLLSKYCSLFLSSASKCSGYT